MLAHRIEVRLSGQDERQERERLHLAWSKPQIEPAEREDRYAIEQLEKSDIFADEIKGLNKNLLLQSCQLHDVGKISICDNILKKPGKLDNEEFEQMKRHTVIGERIITRIESLANKSYFLDYAKTCAISHHERWDGTGYPNGLKENEIPLIGRIMAIVDVYDALTSVRPYKPAFPHEEAVQIITEGSGTQFDPALVEVFLQVSNQFNSKDDN